MTRHLAHPRCTQHSGSFPFPQSRSTHHHIMQQQQISQPRPPLQQQQPRPPLHPQQGMMMMQTPRPASMTSMNPPRPPQQQQPMMMTPRPSMQQPQPQPLPMQTGVGRGSSISQAPAPRQTPTPMTPAPRQPQPQPPQGSVNARPPAATMPMPMQQQQQRPPPMMSNPQQQPRGPRPMQAMTSSQPPRGFQPSMPMPGPQMMPPQQQQNGFNPIPNKNTNNNNAIQTPFPTTFNPGSALAPPPPQFPPPPNNFMQLPPQQQQQQYPPPPMANPMPGQHMPQPSAAGPPSESPNASNSNNNKSRIEASQLPRPNLQLWAENPRDVLTDGMASDGTRNLVPGALEECSYEDNGNANPRFIRTTMSMVPNSSSLLKQSNVPLAVIVQPLAEPCYEERPVPVAGTFSLYNMGANPSADMPPLRCHNSKCRAYINPSVRLVNNSTGWVCNMCESSNEIPSNFNIGVTGNLVAELTFGSVDFIVDKEYITRPIQEPLYLFAFDVSLRAVQSGVLFASLDAASRAIDQQVLAGGERARVGILTYDTEIQFYEVNPKPIAPQEMKQFNPHKLLVTADVHDGFSPLHPRTWMVGAISHKYSLMGLLSYIGNKFRSKLNNQQQQQQAEPTCTGTALRAAFEGLATTGGRVFLFASSPGTIGQGTIKERENSAVYGTEQEHALLAPAEEDKFYAELARSCAQSYVCVDIFLFGQRYADIASLGQVPFATGGSMNFHPGFMASLASHRNKLSSELSRALSRDVAFEAVMKVRCSKGLAVNEYVGEGIKRFKGDVVDMAAWDADTAVAAMLEHDGAEMVAGDKVYIQAAMLYTTKDGQRRVRVHNLSLVVTDNIGSVFKYADCEAVVNVLARYGSVMLAAEQLSTIRANINKKLTDILFSYRSNCAAQSSSGQLILPEALKLSPLYVLATLRSDMLRVNNRVRSSVLEADVRVDARSVSRVECLKCSVEMWIRQTYPRLVALHHLPEECGLVEYEDGDVNKGFYSKCTVSMPRANAPTAEYLERGGIFLLENGLELFLWIGPDAPKELVGMMTGLYDDIPANVQEVVIGGNGCNVPFSQRVLAIAYCALLPESRGGPRSVSDAKTRFLNEGTWPPLTIQIVRNGSASEKEFLGRLIEDKFSLDMSYISFLVQLHKDIQELMANS